jgi:BASS family bile acid:Na+ symporter
MDLLAASAPLASASVRTLAFAFLVTMMLSMGLELGAAPPHSHEQKRHERWLLVRGLVVNLVVMPAVALALVRLTHVTGDIEMALLLLASTPGGRLAMPLVRGARGELGLAVELTLWSAKLTAFTAPPTARLLLGVEHVEVPELKLIAELLFLQILPYAVGFWLGRKRPTLPARLVRPLRFASMTLVVAVFAIVVAGGKLAGLHFFDELGWLVAVTFALLSLTLGWLLGGPEVQTRRAFALSANARDLALTLIIASTALPGRSVELAAIAIWLFNLSLNAAFVALVRRRTRTVAQPAIA